MSKNPAINFSLKITLFNIKFKISKTQKVTHFILIKVEDRVIGYLIRVFKKTNAGKD
ncbi:hypothetical protein C0J52_15694 [Blattella germanica]|nr:hypothetical protein C0J52_15694 [Blattella germanica]